jgi:hypothetical protein
VRAADLIREAIDSEHDRHEDLVKELEEGWATKLEVSHASVKHSMPRIVVGFAKVALGRISV